jgi:molecular chaperone DnaK (HSP70)
VALHYASKLWKKEGDSAQNIMFIDLGQSALTVTIAQYEKSKCKLLATAYDPNLGGRNFDRVLAEHFADEFKVNLTN